MAKNTQHTWTPQTIQTEFERREAAVFQSTNVKSIKSAYHQLLDDGQPELLRAIISQAGAARLVHLVLRGYEIPDARTRLASMQAMIALSDILKDGKIDTSVVEQYWLILAQQRDVLLERVEEDIAALNESELSSEQTDELTDVLCVFHTMIRTSTDEAVMNLFEGTMSESAVS